MRTRPVIVLAAAVLLVVTCLAQPGDGLALEIFLSNRDNLPGSLLEHVTGARVSCAGCPVVLISIDALRPDHLGAYGYEFDTSPAIDEMASESVTFDRAISQGPSTLISHSAVFTSLIPSFHNARISGRRPLSPGAVTLAEVLRDAGYATAGFTGGGQLDERWGVGQGFDVFASRINRGEVPDLGDSDSEDADDGDPEDAAAPMLQTEVDLASEYLDGIGDRPFFLFLHTYEVHSPYAPSPEYRAMFETGYRGDLPRDSIGPDLFREINAGEIRLRKADVRHIKAMYDAEIREADHAFAALVRMLREHGVYDRALIIFMSDHGEELGDGNSVGHNRSLRDIQLRVPLIMKFPGAAYSGTRVANMVRLIDVMPTVLDVVGVEQPPGLLGTSLIDVMHGDLSAVTSAISEKIHPRARLDWMIRTNRWKLYRGKLYDLVLDPGETWSVGTTFVTVREALAREHADMVQLGKARAELDGGAIKMDKALRDRLRALGYIQ